MYPSGFPGGSVIKIPPASAGDVSSIPVETTHTQKKDSVRMDSSVMHLQGFVLGVRNRCFLF